MSGIIKRMQGLHDLRVDTSIPAQTAPGGGPSNAEQLARLQGKEVASTTDTSAASALANLDNRQADKSTQAAKPAATTTDTEIKPDSGFTPAQEKWLGNADRTDPYILSRMRSAVPGAAVGSGPDLGVGTYFDPKTQAVPTDTGMEMRSLDKQSGATNQNFAEEELKNLEEELNEMMRLSGLALNEKAPPGAKAERMVKHIKKGYSKDGKLTDVEKRKAFGATWKAYNKGKLDEGLNMMLDEEGHTLSHIVNRFKHEVRRFIEGDFMPENLYDALYDYYLDRGDMPYGTAKGREGDPYQWVSERFYDDVMRDLGNDMNETTQQPVMDDTLNELAHLAGLTESKLDECGDMGMDQRDTINVSTNMSSDGNKSVNISAQGEKAEELLAMLKLAGMGDKPRFNTDDGVDLDHPGAIEIHGTMDADGAEQLAKQLRHAAMSEEEMMDEAKKTRTTKYKNTPDEEYQSVASITRQGNDLNREKRQYANKPKLGDNPMATETVLDEELSALLDSILVKEADPKRPPGDTGIADIYTADKGIQPPSPDEGPVGKAPKAPPAPAAPKTPTIAPGIKR